MKTLYAYIEGATNIHTKMIKGKCQFTGDSKYQLRKKYPGMMFSGSQSCVDKIEEIEEKLYCEQPHEITQERFDEMLGVLPPCDWRSMGIAEYFHLRERYIGNIASCFFRVRLNDKDRYYECLNRVTRKDSLLSACYDMASKANKEERCTYG